MSTYTFTSESVTEGHPDKMADQVSDAVLDAILTEDPDGRVACETLLTTGLCVIAGEITTSAYVDIPKIARETINGIGYDNASYGFDGNTCGVIVSIDEQSPDIAQGVDTSEEVRIGQSDVIAGRRAIERVVCAPVHLLRHWLSPHSPRDQPDHGARSRARSRVVAMRRHRPHRAGRPPGH